MVGGRRFAGVGLWSWVVRNLLNLLANFNYSSCFKSFLFVLNRKLLSIWSKNGALGQNIFKRILDNCANTRDIYFYSKRKKYSISKSSEKVLHQLPFNQKYFGAHNNQQLTEENKVPGKSHRKATADENSCTQNNKNIFFY